MFTGLIETVGTLRSSKTQGDGAVLSVEAPFAGELAVGDSVAVDGACLTVSATQPGRFAADASRETLERTTLGKLRCGSAVNLERALRFGDRLGGHLVSGHIDGTGRVTRRLVRGKYSELHIEPLQALGGAIVLKGSVAVDGVSLTVSGIDRDEFAVTLIPETLGATALAAKREGATVNIETDMIGKYVREYLAREGAGAAVSGARPLGALFGTRLEEGG